MGSTGTDRNSSLDLGGVYGSAIGMQDYYCAVYVGKSDLLGLPVHFEPAEVTQSALAGPLQVQSPAPIY